MVFYELNMENQTKISPIYFNPEKIGASLKEVGTDYLQLESREIETRWFRDSSGEIDIFIWFNKEKKIIKQQVSIMGLLTEWNTAEGVKTGVILEDELQKNNAADIKENQQSASEIIRFDSAPQAQALVMALRLLENASCLDDILKKTLISHFMQEAPIGIKLLQTTQPPTTKTGFFSKILSRIKRSFLK